MDVTNTTSRQRWTALVLLAAIEFMILLDTSIVNIALPTIKASLHFFEADLQWVQNAYILVFGGFSAARRTGRRSLRETTFLSDRPECLYRQFPAGRLSLRLVASLPSHVRCRV